MKNEHKEALLFLYGRFSYGVNIMRSKIITVLNEKYDPTNSLILFKELNDLGVIKQTRGNCYRLIKSKLKENDIQVFDKSLYVRKPEEKFRRKGFDVVTKKVCLVCSKPFMSKHKFNRICINCSSNI